MRAISMVRQLLRPIAERVPLSLAIYRKLRDELPHDPLCRAMFSKVFERHRLTLSAADAESFAPETENVELPTFHPLFAGEDAPLNDLLFLLALAKGRQAKRILEVGTYRARTTYALARNCPEATIVSYDIQVLGSRYRRELLDNSRVHLRLSSFTADESRLRGELPFDLIFVDGSHRFDIALADSRLAVELVAPGGVVVWHDYRLNGYMTEELRVPEVMQAIAQSYSIAAVRETMCAVYVRPAQ